MLSGDVTLCPCTIIKTEWLERIFYFLGFVVLLVAEVPSERCEGTDVLALCIQTPESILFFTLQASELLPLGFHGNCLQRTLR